MSLAILIHCQGYLRCVSAILQGYTAYSVSSEVGGEAVPDRQLCQLRLRS